MRLSKLLVGILVVLFPLAVAGLLDDNLPMDSYVIVVTETDYIRSAGSELPGLPFKLYRLPDRLERSNSQLKSPTNMKQPKLRKGPMTKIQRRPGSQHNDNSLLKDKNSTDIKISESKTPSYWVNYLYAPQSTHAKPPQLAQSRSQSPLYKDILLQHYYQSSTISTTVDSSPLTPSRANIVDLVVETRKNDNPGFFKQGKFPDYNYFVNNIL